jgi:hypothetical protein
MRLSAVYPLVSVTVDPVTARETERTRFGRETVQFYLTDGAINTCDPGVTRGIIPIAPRSLATVVLSTTVESRGTFTD